MIVLDIPGSNNQMLSFGTRSSIKILRYEQKARLYRHVSILLELLETSTQREEEEDKPRNADFNQHLQV